VIRASLTSGVVMSAGDLICQRVQNRDKEIDLRRTARFATVGMCMHGPFFLFGFQWLDSLVPKTPQGPTLKGAMFKVLAGQLTLFPVYLGSALLALSLLEGKAVDRSVAAMQQTFVPTYLAGSVFWPIANVFNFMFVPSSYRVLYVNVAGLFWNTYLSFVQASSSSYKQFQ
jgi:protein Mpv17